MFYGAFSLSRLFNTRQYTTSQKSIIIEYDMRMLSRHLQYRHSFCESLTPGSLHPLHSAASLSLNPSQTLATSPPFIRLHGDEELEHYAHFFLPPLPLAAGTSTVACTGVKEGLNKRPRAGRKNRPEFGGRTRLSWPPPPPARGLAVPSSLHCSHAQPYLRLHKDYRAEAKALVLYFFLPLPFAGPEDDSGTAATGAALGLGACLGAPSKA
jgi:hypothetical protein